MKLHECEKSNPSADDYDGMICLEVGYGSSEIRLHRGMALQEMSGVVALLITAMRR